MRWTPPGDKPRLLARWMIPNNTMSVPHKCSSGNGRWIPCYQRCFRSQARWRKNRNLSFANHWYNDYQDSKIPDLATPLNDAKEMADLLKGRYGFVVNTLLGRKAMEQVMYNALRDLASRSEPDDSVLIYYAGHGQLDQQYNDGWWIPIDAKAGVPVTFLNNVQ